MALINNSFTFATCSECQRTIKIEVGKDIKTIKCDCEQVVEEVKKPEEPPKRSMRKKVENATSTI